MQASCRCVTSDYGMRTWRRRTYGRRQVTALICAVGLVGSFLGGTPGAFASPTSGGSAQPLAGPSGAADLSPRLLAGPSGAAVLSGIAPTIVSSVIVSHNGALTLGGDGGALGSEPYIARYDPAGHLDSIFGQSGIYIGLSPVTFVNALLLEPNGDVIAAGNWAGNGGDSGMWLDRLSPYGQPVPGVRPYSNNTLGRSSCTMSVGASSPLIPGPCSAITQVAYDDGEVLALVRYGTDKPSQTSTTSLRYADLGAFNSNGTLDTTFDGSGLVKLPPSWSTPVLASGSGNDVWVVAAVGDRMTATSYDPQGLPHQTLSVAAPPGSAPLHVISAAQSSVLTALIGSASSLSVVSVGGAKDSWTPVNCASACRGLGLDLWDGGVVVATTDGARDEACFTWVGSQSVASAWGYTGTECLRFAVPAIDGIAVGFGAGYGVAVGLGGNGSPVVPSLVYVRLPRPVRSGISSSETPRSGSHASGPSQASPVASAAARGGAPSQKTSGQIASGQGVSASGGQLLVATCTKGALHAVAADVWDVVRDPLHALGAPIGGCYAATVGVAFTGWGRHVGGSVGGYLASLLAGAASGAVSGGVVGALGGSFVPGVGTAVGAGLGAAIGSINGIVAAAVRPVTTRVRQDLPGPLGNALAGAFQGAVIGAATGAVIGSVVPVVGTVVGAAAGMAIGTLAGVVGGLLSGSL